MWAQRRPHEAAAGSQGRGRGCNQPRRRLGLGLPASGPARRQVVAAAAQAGALRYGHRSRQRVPQGGTTKNSAGKRGASQAERPRRTTTATEDRAVGAPGAEGGPREPPRCKRADGMVARTAVAGSPTGLHRQEPGGGACRGRTREAGSACGAEGMPARKSCCARLLPPAFSGARRPGPHAGGSGQGLKRQFEEPEASRGHRQGRDRRGTCPKKEVVARCPGPPRRSEAMHATGTSPRGPVMSSAAASLAWDRARAVCIGPGLGTRSADTGAQPCPTGLSAVKNVFSESVTRDSQWPHGGQPAATHGSASGHTQLLGTSNEPGVTDQLSWFYSH